MVLRAVYQEGLIRRSKIIRNPGRICFGKYGEEVKGLKFSLRISKVSTKDDVVRGEEALVRCSSGFSWESVAWHFPVSFYLEMC